MQGTTIYDDLCSWIIQARSPIKL